MHTLPGVFYCFFPAGASPLPRDGHELRRPIVGHSPRKFPAASVTPRRNLPVHPILHRAGLIPIPVSGTTAQRYPGTQLYYYKPRAGIYQMNYVI